MNDERPERSLTTAVGKKASRMLKARAKTGQNGWLGLGVAGIIGWSVVVPTLLGAAAGMWLDKHAPSEHGWTLALLVAGLTLGCFNAWVWVAKQEAEIREDEESDIV
jgi:ATP synthase protein I